MTETLFQVPAIVNIEVSIDDSFSTLVDFDISLAGYTITAFVDVNDGIQQEFSIDTTGDPSQTIIGLTKEQIKLIGVGHHNWYYLLDDGNGYSRRALAGKFTVVKYGATQRSC